MSRSILSNERECYICHSPFNLHRHHIFHGSARRQTSEREGCWVYLCAYHHNLSDDGVHFDHELDLSLKRECQRAWEARNGGRKRFMDVFGVSYL